jgi:hypothetical protein
MRGDLLHCSLYQGLNSPFYRKGGKMFLDFKQISKDVEFKQVLDWLNIPYQETKTELKTENIIANKEKNLFFHKQGGKGGSVIQFYADHSNQSVREAALVLFKQFIKQPDKPKREIPELTLQYCQFLEKRGFSEEFSKKMNIGLCKQKSILNGFICVKTGIHYIGYKEKENKWFFPKGFTRDFLYNPLKTETESIICTADVFNCLYLISQDLPSVSIMGNSATDKQIELLSKFKNILLIHKEPHNIAIRLMANSFVKTYNNSVEGIEAEQIKALF